MMSKKISVTLIALIILQSFSSIVFAEQKKVPKESSTDNKIILEYEFAQPALSKQGLYDVVKITGLDSYHNTAQPIIPVKPVTILIPLGKKVSSVKATPLEIIELAGQYTLPPAQAAYPRSYTGPKEKTELDKAISEMSIPWPSIYYRKASTQYKRGYQLLLVNLFPVQYTPKLGKLTCTKKILLEIELTKATDVEVVKPTANIEKLLRKRVDNPSSLSSYSDERIENYKLKEKAKDSPLDKLAKSLSRKKSLEELLDTNKVVKDDKKLRIRKTKDGYVHFMGAGQETKLSLSVEGVEKTDKPEEIAKAFLKQNKKLFVDDSPNVVFQMKKIRTRGQKGKERHFVRYKQTYSGLDVFGAEAIVQIDSQGNVVSVVSDIMCDTYSLDAGKLSTTAKVDVEVAKSQAIDLLAKQHKGLRFVAVENGLKIYEPSVLGYEGNTQLVWHIEVSGISQVPK